MKSTLSLNSRLAAYTAAGAAAAAAAVAPSAQAAVVTSGPVSINIPTTSAGVYLNVVTGVSSASPTTAVGWDLNLWGTSTLFAYGQGTGNGALNNFTGGSSTTLIDNLPVGTPVSGAFTFGSTSVETTGLTAFNLNSSSNYVGFRFTNEATGAINYGWAQVSLSTTLIAQPRTILSYAYENTGAPILVGVVPEPGTNAAIAMGALALGAMGVRRWKQSKQVA